MHVFERCEAIKQNFLVSSGQPGDTDKAVNLLMVECAGVFHHQSKAWEFLMEPPAKGNKETEVPE
ncbi:MAG: hypothetical protein BroJett012_07590 [Betaproteobacteria bacterium]|jgi:hypothetical protein|nr:MAG: hypothetical protein BroJett012_07590 [Betaproteobacteria bacterium]